jgi:hypothetical protein
MRSAATVLLPFNPPAGGFLSLTAAAHEDF